MQEKKQTRKKHWWHYYLADSEILHVHLAKFQSKAFPVDFSIRLTNLLPFSCDKNRKQVQAAIKKH